VSNGPRRKERDSLACPEKEAEEASSCFLVNKVKFHSMVSDDDLNLDPSRQHGGENAPDHSAQDKVRLKRIIKAKFGINIILTTA
jgi:hypothetical protein